MKAIVKKQAVPTALAVNTPAAALVKAPAPGEMVELAAQYWIDRHGAVNHRPHMLATLIALNSPRSGYPIPMILTEKVSGEAWGFLQTCREITDNDLLTDLDESSQKDFFNERSKLAVKTIVVRNLDKLKKGKDGLMKLLHDGLNGGKTNFVAITTNAKEALLASPYVLKMCLPPAPIDPAAFSSVRADERYVADLKVGAGRLKLHLSLIKPQEVEIPYLKQLADSLGQGFSPSRGGFQILVNFILNVTLLNNVQPDAIVQLMSEKLFNVDYATWQMSRYSGTTHSCPAPSAPIKSTKVDYYYVWLLRDVILNLADLSLNSHEQRVFKALKDYNWDAITNSGDGPVALINFDNPKEVKQALNLNEKAWAAIEDIMENVNTGTDEMLDEPTVKQVLTVLEKKGMPRAKYTQRTNIRFIP